MKYLWIADMTCSGDITTCCGDYGIATFLFIIKKLLGIVHLVVPMILIVMSAIGLIQLMLDPDDRNNAKMKSLLNKFKAALLVFFLPYIVGLLIGLIPDSLEVSGCWKAAEEIANVMENTSSSSPSTSSDSSTSSSSSNTSQGTDKWSEKDVSATNVKATGENVVKYARKYLGNPYVYGGTSLTNGVDCSGFTMKVYEYFGISLPRTAAEQSTKGKQVSSLSDAQPGDLIFYRDSNGTIGHVAIYIGDGKIIHAAGSKKGIIEASASYRTVASIKRMI